MKKSFERVGVKGAKNELRSFGIETSCPLTPSFVHFFCVEEMDE